MRDCSTPYAADRADADADEDGSDESECSRWRDDEQGASMRMRSNEDGAKAVGEVAEWEVRLIRDRTAGGR